MGYLIPEYGLDRRHRDLQDDAYYHDGSLITERGRFNLVAYLQIAVSLFAMASGVYIVIGTFLDWIQSVFGVSWLVIPEGVPLFILAGLASLVLGYLSLRIGIAIRKMEMWAFSSLLYTNILLEIALMLSTLGVATVFLLAEGIRWSNIVLIALSPSLVLVPLLPIFTLFQPAVELYWYPNFREDMTPRMKELRYSLMLIRRSPLVVVGIGIIVTFVLLALLAPVIAPYGPEQRIWRDSNLPPGSPSSQAGMPVHFWGTDDTGGDIFSRILYSAQVDLRISITVVLIAVFTGTIIGAVAGYYGGKIDELVMRVTDVFFAFPGLVLAMAIVMALGERSMENISIALMVTWWPAYARLVRGQVLTEREKLYVEAARSLGASDARVLTVHIIPNTIQPLIVQATMDTGSVLLVAAGLAFIGFGPPAGVAEWGLMIAIGQIYFLTNPWGVFFPGFAILFTSLAFNLVGDGIRDIMDPKLRRR
jgi:peptide/nickel transport system permease protein